MYFERPLVRAYVDETGDRGLSARASRYFGMVAVTIADEDDPGLRSAIAQCRRRLSVPTTKPLHWTEHVKRFPRRQFVASQLAQVAGAVLDVVLVEKTAIAGAVSDQVAFYNFVAGRVLEHVRGFRHEETLAWFEKLRANESPDLPWDLLRGKPRFLGPGQLDGLQAADQYCGMLRSALEADEFGGFEEHHLMAVRHQIRDPGGFEGIVLPGTMAAYPWWPVAGL